jgi:Do/DeqQ family serine protease
MNMKKTIAAFLVAGMGGAAALGLEHLLDRNEQHAQLLDPQPVNYVNMPAAGAENTVNFTSAAEMTVHAVVHVKTTYAADATQQYGFDPFRDFFYGQPSPQPQMSSGSGVIISNDGYIVTNNHVIDKAEKIEIALNDKRTYTAELVGKDPTTDLALLKIKEQGLPFLAYGNSDNVKVGEWVLAVGNPFNLTSTVTAGIVSAKGRSINILENNPDQGLFPIESFIQTDAAVNPGNSGGALVNTEGQLVGINSAIASTTGSYAGYSFAVPVNIVKKVVADLLEYGTVQRAFIGVSIRDIDSKFAEEKGFKSLKGVYVNGLTENGAAASAGIEEGDVLLKVGEMEVNNVPELQEQIGRFRPGDKVMVTLRRGLKEVILPVVLKNQKGNTELVQREKSAEASVGALGATFEAVSKEDMKRLNIDSGLRITKLSGGKLRSAGIREGFIITSVDKKKITSVGDIEAALANKKGGVLIEGVYPNGMRAYYGFGL